MAGACEPSPAKAWTHRGVRATYKSSPRKGLWHSPICYLIIYKERKPHYVTLTWRDPWSLTAGTAVCCSGRWMHGWAEIKYVLLLPQPGFFSIKMVHLTRFLPSHLHVHRFPFSAKNCSLKYLLFFPCSLAISLAVVSSEQCGLFLFWLRKSRASSF